MSSGGRALAPLSRQLSPPEHLPTCGKPLSQPCGPAHMCPSRSWAFSSGDALPGAPGCRQPPPPRTTSPGDLCWAGPYPFHSPWSRTPPGQFGYLAPLDHPHRQPAPSAAGRVDPDVMSAVEPLPLILPVGPGAVDVPVVTSAGFVMFCFALTGAANTSSF